MDITIPLQIIWVERWVAKENWIREMQLIYYDFITDLGCWFLGRKQ